MYSTIDVNSATVDFVKDNVEDGVVDSLPSCGAGWTSIYLPSSLWGCQLALIQQYSYLPRHQNVHTPQRQLYCNTLLYNMQEAKEKDLIHYNNKSVSIKQPISWASQSHGAIQLRHLDKEGRLLWAQSFLLPALSTNVARQIALYGPECLFFHVLVLSRAIIVFAYFSI